MQGMEEPSAYQAAESLGVPHGNYPLHEASSTRGMMQGSYQGSYHPCEQDKDEAQDRCSTGAATRKAILNADIALKIYSSRNSDSLFKTAESAVIARHFSISSKAVRDIWDRRTWAHVTMPLWTDEERAEYESMNKRAPGRPVGAKDSRPRKRRKDRKRSPSPLQEQTSSSPVQSQQGVREAAAAAAAAPNAEAAYDINEQDMRGSLYQYEGFQTIQSARNSVNQVGSGSMEDLADTSVNNFNDNETVSCCFKQSIGDAMDNEVLPPPENEQEENGSPGNVVNENDPCFSFLTYQQDEQQEIFQDGGENGGTNGQSGGSSKNSSPNPLQDSPEWFVQSSAEDIQAYVAIARNSDSSDW
ncbi:hypothetical protein GUITHDRAFT_110135 [Guillardia theta CCMP2712]|uniref:Uncharacterized protein n=1 Tax=Guillardia theta (strain CCMP2712) TaxID=905079 RepID=L1J688_GUITC|nr:hypothetical protein GUITHDRAFT_110135 [Guillardia theta CCMP2712]EKX44031.1 hypothetical protein GUITHDRAFT_110135 [Guillardia theta CCMP2712]|eukprot:XP_005831011.1 hypothetical protein GUITHDRAFT_110135 [Guillardia theta CCMP2712]